MKQWRNLFLIGSWFSGWHTERVFVCVCVDTLACVCASPDGHTHRVRSLGMWLKLDSGMRVMLLLLRVLFRTNTCKTNRERRENKKNGKNVQCFEKCPFFLSRWGRGLTMTNRKQWISINESFTEKETAVDSGKSDVINKIWRHHHSTQESMTQHKHTWENYKLGLGLGSWRNHEFLLF